MISPLASSRPSPEQRRQIREDPFGDDDDGLVADEEAAMRDNLMVDQLVADDPFNDGINRVQ